MEKGKVVEPGSFLQTAPAWCFLEREPFSADDSFFMCLASNVVIHPLDPGAKKATLFFSLPLRIWERGEGNALRGLGQLFQTHSSISVNPRKSLPASREEFREHLVSNFTEMYFTNAPFGTFFKNNPLYRNLYKFRKSPQYPPRLMKILLLFPLHLPK